MNFKSRSLDSWGLLDNSSILPSIERRFSKDGYVIKIEIARRWKGQLEKFWLGPRFRYERIKSISTKFGRILKILRKISLLKTGFSISKSRKVYHIE